MTGDYRVGRLLCGTFRDGLRKLQFQGESVEWIESSGWLVRIFTVRSSASVHQALARWVEQVNKEEPAT